ncbi:MAG: hypothetical protein DLM71_04685 [Chloroflexi bacterium]|nr:MAG: hypothetical protein DLM71_04685 [Chloroflexota bacterium]
MIEVLCGLIGVLVVATVLWDVFETVVLPRPSPTRVRPARNLVRLTWPIWRSRALGRDTSLKRERVLGTYAPILVLMLLATWITLLALGFGGILYALRAGIRPVPDLATAIYFAGESVLTLGYGDIVAVDSAARVASLLAAALGLGVLALGITYLFSLYDSFQKREVLVVRLEARAGAPPSGVALLETYGSPGRRDALGDFFLAWEAWAAEVLDTHVAYPILAYFRSSHDNVSWVSSVGAVLDASALVLTTVSDGPSGEAQMVQRLGQHFVEDLANFFGWPADRSPAVERHEFDAARQRLLAAGYRCRDADEAWLQFQTLRSAYAARLNAMASFWVTPPAMWIGDRSARHAVPDLGRAQR